jgi:hypothetical protein
MSRRHAKAVRDQGMNCGQHARPGGGAEMPTTIHSAVNSLRTGNAKAQARDAAALSGLCSHGLWLY